MLLMAYGIMGGTFDPVHNGHLLMAEAAMTQHALDEVLFIPDGDPPHKAELAPAEDRLKMVELALKGREGFRALDMEVRRAGQTFTVDTLERLSSDHPSDQFVFIVGADTLMQIETWRNFPRVASLLSGIACAPRAGISAEAVDGQIARLKEQYNLKVLRLSMAPVDVSSTEVRRLVARGLFIGRMVPEGVAQYIRDRGLYQDPMLAELQRALSKERYRHTLGVEQTAVKLAELYGEDPEKARVAALLHDCARCLDSADMRRLVGERVGGSALRALMHAPAGAELARQKYGIEDDRILSAIRWHTTGHEGMTRLEKIVYLADFIEPNRPNHPGLQELRAEAFRDLDRAVRMAAESTMRYVRARGLEPDENTMKMLGSEKSTEGIV
jgi:nicotinate-nucleotide adenylyltransferase